MTLTKMATNNQLPPATKMLTRKSSSGNMLSLSSLASAKSHVKDYTLDKNKALGKRVKIVHVNICHMK